jgi:hypothetical protein
MKKRLLADDEFNQVLKLKQAGASWLKIQREAGIPRRIAQRAYEDWQKNQSFVELKESRRTVATEAFREHVASLISVGTFLAMNLDIPGTISADSPSGAQIVDNLWQKIVLGEAQDQTLQQLSGTQAERVSRSITRQHQMLFQALQDHTRCELRWEVLEDWEMAWNQSKQYYAALRKEAAEVMGNFLRQENGLEKKINSGNRKGDGVTQIAVTLLGVIWTRILDGKLDLQPDIFEFQEGPRNEFFVAIRGDRDSVFLTYHDKNLAEKTARLGNNVARSLLLGEKKDIIEKSLRGSVAVMKKAIDDLAEMLNPLLLRPIIFKTHCKLCPA